MSETTDVIVLWGSNAREAHPIFFHHLLTGIDNGARMITYAISAPRGSGTVLLNGPAARRGMVGDLISVLSYCDITDEEARQLEPKVILVNEKNRPRGR